MGKGRAGQLRAKPGDGAGEAVAELNCRFPTEKLLGQRGVRAAHPRIVDWTLDVPDRTGLRAERDHGLGELDDR